MKIVPYDEQWPKIFQAEKELISSKLCEEIIEKGIQIISIE